MINLLPPELQESYRYAQRNVRLMRWAMLFALAFIGLVAMSGGGLIYLRQQTDNYNQQVATGQATLQSQNQAKIQKQVQDMSNSMQLAVRVLSKEILFSELLKQLAAITPSNAKLANLSISQVKGALDITANTTDYAAATQLQVNLSDPNNKIFSKADIVSISCAQSSSGSSGSSQTNARYPCSVVIRALFVSNNPFLFINNKPGAGS